jgi:GNAT superfamily N-acetyltransferase
MKFNIHSEEGQEDRTEISLNGIGSVTLVETLPEYEFIEDVDEDTLEELGVEEGDLIGKIEHIVVNDEHKGKGYGRLLMNKAIEVAKEKGLMPLYLNASPMGYDGLDIDDLTGFYESFGFEVFLQQGRNNLMILKDTYKIGGQTKNKIMEKQMKMNFENGGVTYSEWLKEDSFQEEFNNWMEDDNVIKNPDGTYSTQDAQYRNSLKDMSELQMYFYNEFIKGQYAEGGEVEYETKRIVNEAKNQKKNTHFAIHKPTNSIVFTWDYSGYDTKEMNENKEHYFYYDVKDIVSGNVDKYVKSDYAIVQRKDLEKRGIDLNNYLVFLGQKYDRLESNNESDGGEAGFDNEGTNMVMYHEEKGNFMIPKGQIYLWLYEGEKIGEKLQNEEYDWVFYPYANINMAFQKGFIPPLKRIWTKKFQKDHKGSEHLLGVIKAYLIEKEGQKELYIDMMSVNPTKMKKGIMSYMIKELRDTFNLTQDQVTFSKLTPEGKKFVEKKTYADGGVAETMNFFVVNNENDKNYNRVGYSIDETITDYKQGKEFEKLYFENKKLPKKYNVNDLIYLEQRSHFTQKDKYSDGETSFVILVDYESSPKPYYYLYNVTKKFVATEGGLDWVKSNLPKGWKFYDSYSDGGGINESISETDKLDSEIFNSLLKIYKSEGNSGTDLFSFSESKLQKLLSEGAFNRLKSGKSPLGKIQLYGGSLGKYYAINIANGDFYERLKKYADGGEIKYDKYGRGGFMYEVQKKGSPSNDMKETLFTAKNLTELKKKIIEKYGTSEGFMVGRRTEQGYFVPVKFADGGEAAEYQIIDKKTEKYYSRSISDGKIKWNDSPDMGYMFTMKDANQIKESLHQSGYEQLEVVKYDANWWKKV